MHQHNLIVWNDEAQKWTDTNNNYFCSPLGVAGRWRVSARYGFDDGSHTREFDNEIDAMLWFVNFLHSYHVELIVDGYEVWARKRGAAA